MFELHEEPSDSIDDLLDEFNFVGNNKKVYYLNVASAFDIESSSFLDDDKNKVACMYAWTFNLNGKHILGRTWYDFLNVLDTLSNFYHLDDNHRLIIYIHNLSYEFQFIRKLIKWKKVFLLKERQVCYALTTTGIEFRCSYILSGYNLAELGNHLIKYKIQKMIGDLDYSKIRHSTTFLEYKELKYIYHDSLVVVAYIQEQIELENGIQNIPLTKTGYVRRYVRNCCLYDGSHKKNTSKYLRYRKIIKSLTIGSVNEYKQVKNSYLGAHTHANPLAVGMIMNNVYSLDFNSSYPYVMASSDDFPMSKGHRCEIKSKEDFLEKLDLYFCIFDITFYNIESTVAYEHVIPASRCLEKENAILDNGKVIRADKIVMSLNSIDYKSFSTFYKWDSIGIKNFRYYMKGYLPKEIILAVLHLYKKKTELKGVPDKAVDYMKSKEQLNSCYGMACTDICRDDIIYDENNEYVTKECDYEKALIKYNKSSNRFLYYLWGQVISSTAKANLFSGIHELKYDFLYSDTDSCKCLHYEKHKKYFDTYNDNCRKKLLKMCKFYKLNPELIEPKTIDGIPKLLGAWDKEFKDGEPSYLKFKTLGSKRYCYQYPDGTYSFTISGCDKESAIPYLAIGLTSDIKTHKENFEILDKIDNEMYIPPEYTGKNCHTYFDYEVSGIITDYLGKKGKYHEFSGVNIMPIEFTLNMADNFVDYILGLRGVL